MNSIRIHAGLLADTAGCVRTTKPRIKTTTVNVAIGRSTDMPEPCAYYATPDMDAYAYDCMYDPKRISLADAEQWVRNQLAEQGVNVARFINEDADDDARITYKAAGIYLAEQLYGQALKEDNPAAALDDIANAIPDTMPRVFQDMGTAPDLAAALLPSITGLVWAFTAIEHSRIEAGDGYGYLFDYMAGLLKNGADPNAIRRDALAAPARIRELAEQAGDDQ
ncbi:hypothetical protein ACF090_13110 [Streptomyces sp. NPDC014892]|uniref:hypothetical protein n=1 Tax=Streptomyces sp. NPDC014892 TaxID=3364930 RepID=UPI0036F799BD